MMAVAELIGDDQRLHQEKGKAMIHSRADRQPGSISRARGRCAQHHPGHDPEAGDQHHQRDPHQGHPRRFLNSLTAGSPTEVGSVSAGSG